MIHYLNTSYLRCEGRYFHQHNFKTQQKAVEVYNGVLCSNFQRHWKIDFPAIAWKDITTRVAGEWNTFSWWYLEVIFSRHMHPLLTKLHKHLQLRNFYVNLVICYSWRGCIFSRCSNVIPRNYNWDRQTLLHKWQWCCSGFL